MPPRRPTPEVTQTIAAYVRAGSFPEDAAEAAGVPLDTFRRWLDSARGRKPLPAYRDFLRALDTAAAQARVAASLAVHRDDPVKWLTKGPGKQTPDRPGWTREVKPLILAQDNRTVNLLADPGAAALIQTLLAALADHPEARKDVLRALNGDARPRAALPPPKAVDAIVSGPGSANGQPSSDP